MRSFLFQRPQPAVTTAQQLTRVHNCATYLANKMCSRVTHPIRWATLRNQLLDGLLQFEAGIPQTYAVSFPEGEFIRDPRD